MGIHLNLAVLLAEIARHHRLGGRVVTLGEQSLTFDPERVALGAVPVLGGAAPSQSPAARLFARLGFAATESVDIDGAGGATHLFDLNLPDTPATLSGKFDLVFNGGTLEHVFHLPNALANVSRMMREGGVALHVLPCNNWVDHGFYQFSPCLMFDYYRAAGFEVLESMLLAYVPEQPDRWLVRCASPGLFGAGLAGALDDALYLHLFAARRGARVALYPVPIQTPYAPDDEDAPATRDRARWFAPFALCGGTRHEIPPRAELVLPTSGFAAETGHAWTVPLAQFAALADTMERPARSPLILLEDGVPLGPPHAAHAEIRSRGRGRYSHWGANLHLATSDNSPPASNGRRYSILIPGATALDALRGLPS
jgi:SAM-dependent methyltransferase